MKLKKKTRVLVAMSGGVDSSVAALLMKKKGYEIIGAFMKNWSDKESFEECGWKKEWEMAQKIASRLDIPIIAFDYEKEYREQVIEKMFKDYKKGITPNPDIDCNKKIKFPFLIKEAKSLKCDFVVTGHYGQIKKTKKCFKLLRAKDESKDQSYFLYTLKQSELKNLIFPIGEYTKKEVREIARKNKFPNHDKKSTVGICFIGKINLKKFLQKKIKPKKGKILSPEGIQIGEHDGIYYYTIGQRLGPKYGIDISKNTDNKKNLKRWYVARKNGKKNEIIAAPENHEILYRKEVFLKNPHWINIKPKNNEKIHARIRQVGELLPSKISYDKKKIKVILSKAITGISEGQACVLYQKQKCLGGGEIRFG
ncbi:tRNA 2-thiouridine(34) synthase MnmA [Candidatus Pacearchaeota archaeon CG10_big_fil_rev_8_21_14_0_10_34_12]|nr:MAG: tRNA 2-thiouridine(34) synthase MnmA [Candidatus Pacearchaeota archaeon CG10_big_fil_rev_8_21_14_0_10_34_12]